MKSSLGRGLDALIKPNLIEDKSGEKVTDLSNIKLDDGKQVDILAKIAVDLISPNPFQPRTNFDPAALEELKKSILINGLIQPITVRRIQGNRYQLISGERRLRAFKDIGYKEIPAYIIKVDSDEVLLALALIENIQREHLNPIEVAKAYKRLIDECHLTQEEIADKVGKDRTTIANTIRLLKLPDRIQEALIREEISMGHARALISLPDEQLQLFALEKILKDGLSVRKVEQLAKVISQKSSDSKKSGVVSINSNSFANIHTNDLEDRLRRIFGTKVVCTQRKDGSGEIKIEFYSNDELERLLELFEIINKTYS
ncbi:ParB/RepB/Spo0J family partition protein [Ignavibacterium sp.]|jgi:ParB family chromosome partitioning protein|uniref:ParB/RepB/Spo0J family partition protein n=2 Tax=Ignavibacterium TaxID=795750 RepID=UPI0025C5CB95|nr:ParB/RepB/Spo0J family partition protein [Ignavibacterium sp.]